jgi:hypothetical protein
MLRDEAAFVDSGEDFATYQKSEQDRWFKVIKENDIRGD